MAELYSRVGRGAEAIHEAEEVLKINPNEVDAHRLLADIYFRSLAENQPDKTKQNLRKAIEHLEAVTRLDPSDSGAFVLLGRLYKANNQNEKAEETFKKVLNSIRRIVRFSAWYLSLQRPLSGSIRANHAFSVQASDAMTM